MLTSKDRIYNLLQAYSTGTATFIEKQELFEWIENTRDTKVLNEHIDQIMQDTSIEEDFPEVSWDNIYNEILRKNRLVTQNEVKPKTTWKVKRYYQPVAATFFVSLLGIATYFFFKSKEEAQPVIAKISQHDEPGQMPGNTNAVLSAGGSQVILHSLDTTFNLAGNSVHLSGGELNVSEVKEEQYTLTTPRGGTYRVNLADGTTVWLNADSKLIYPSIFTGVNRSVTIEGEAYFDVAHNPDQPFIVNTAGQTLKVLGTEFNVQAYQDEDKIVTTLFTGGIKLSTPDETIEVLPGEQTEWNKSGAIQLNRYADIDQAIAWRNGYFRFHKADIKTIMRQLTRWYDVEVSYDPRLKPQYFGGLISRSNDLSQVLKLLEATNDIHFKKEGRRIIVMP